METKTQKRPEIQQRVLLKNIILGENYRKTIDENVSTEMTASIKEKGVLQPVLMRYTKIEWKFELVAGYVRHMISDALSLIDIPAIIRDLTDEEVAEIQLIENLQRSEVHPMQEAKGFAHILETGNKSIEVIAAHIGKSANYVARRLKLNDVIPEFQKIFEEGKIDLVQMEKLFRIDAKAQKEYWKEVKQLIKDGDEINITNGELNRFIGDLSNATFNLTDISLNKFNRISCLECPHNSGGNNILFPEDVSNSKCGNIECFNLKTTFHFDHEFEKVKNDPSIELIVYSYSHSKLNENTERLKKAGHKILTLDDYSVFAKPEIDIDEWNSDYETKKEYEKGVAEQKKDFEKKLAAYEKQIASGKFTKAFMVDGARKGQYFNIILSKTKSDGSKIKNTTAELKAKIAENKVTSSDLGSEINRIKEKNKRNRELDEEKISPLVYEHLSKDPVFKNNMKPLSNDEKIAAIIAVNGDQYKMSVYTSLKKSKALDAELASALRNFFISKLHETIGNREKKASTAILEDIALAYNPKKTKEIRENQIAERIIREERAEAKLDDLKKKIKKLGVDKPKTKAKKQ